MFYTGIIGFFQCKDNKSNGFKIILTYKTKDIITVVKIINDNISIINAPLSMRNSYLNRIKRG